MMETLVQLYLKRDLGAIWPLQIAMARKHGMETNAFDTFEKHLLTQRNTRMRDRALSGHLAYGGVFIAVGALHLPGSNGLVPTLSSAMPRPPLRGHGHRPDNSPLYDLVTQALTSPRISLSRFSSRISTTFAS